VEDWTEQVKKATLTHARKVMRLVYVDEAGTGDIKQEPATVVAAVIINGDTQWKNIESDIDDLRSDFPGLSRDTELKANKIFRGLGDFQSWNRLDRITLQKRLLGLIKRHNLPINAAVVDREYLKECTKGKRAPTKPEDFALVMCLYETEAWFCGHAAGEVGCIVADESDRESNFKASLKTFRKYPIGPVRAKYNHLIEPILFTDSREAWGVQLADHAAFFIKRMLLKKADSLEFFEIIKKNITAIPVFERTGKDELEKTAESLTT
jgi:hypothetical protein